MADLTMHRRGAAAEIVFDRPPVNALSRSLLEELAAAVDQLGADDGVAVVHFRSAGRAFCAGADLAEMRVGFSGPEGAEVQVAFIRRLQEVFKRIEDLPAVTVAEIGGPALGGGLELALACDMRIGAQEARMGLPEVGLGLVPGAGGTQRLTRLCGASVARRLILGSEVIDGATAAALGILHWAVPAAELSATARVLVDRIAGLPRAALAGAKSCIAAAATPGDAGYELEVTVSRSLMDDPETRRRVGDFLAKRR